MFIQGVVLFIFLNYLHHKENLKMFKDVLLFSFDHGLWNKETQTLIVLVYKFEWKLYFSFNKTFGKLYRVVELIGGGCVINGATPSSFPFISAPSELFPQTWKKHFFVNSEILGFRFGGKNMWITRNLNLRHNSINQIFNLDAFFFFFLTVATWCYCVFTEYLNILHHLQAMKMTF